MNGTRDEVDEEAERACGLEGQADRVGAVRRWAKGIDDGEGDIVGATDKAESAAALIKKNMMRGERATVMAWATAWA